MSGTVQSARKDDAASTRERLVRAAAAAFNCDGYHGTNSNKIARDAGFSPQTFYRHFDDKIDIFLAVYDLWQASERQAVTRALNSAAQDVSIARAVLDHHVEWRIFRGSLRLLAVTDARVRRARAASRERQLESLARVPGNAGRPRASLVAALLAIERLCDAVADQELEDLGLGGEEVVALVADAVRLTRGSPPQP